MELEEFRSVLDQITSSKAEASEWWPQIEGLRTEYPHSISQVQPNVGRPFNCYMFAFGLESSAKHQSIYTTEPNVYADSCFATFLLRRGELREKSCPQAKDGDIVIYFDNGVIRHGGRAHSNGTVLSKWGWPSSLLFVHPPREVPASYGEDTICYEAISPRAMTKLFVRYARAMGYKIPVAAV